MSRFILILVAIALLGVLAVGCGEDTPTAPPPQPGTVVVDVTPDDPVCPWQLTGPGDYSHDGNGDESLPDLTAGDYTLTWGAVPAFDLPDPGSQTLTLAAGGTVTFSGTYTSVGPESVSVPDAPTGPAAGVEHQDLAYHAAGAVSNHGHDVEYRFDWGDGSFSDWGAPPVQNSWAAVGTYEVKAQARCIADVDIESDWSAAFSVTITVFVAETVSVPDAPTGSASNEASVSAQYTTGGAVSSYGDDLVYRFDWGDGHRSSWSSSTTASHSWAAEGTYEVTAQARCETHNTVESTWSVALEVTVTPATGEIISVPDAPGGPVTGETDETLAYTADGAVSDDGHLVEYRFDFGDGTVTNWLHTVTSASHAWSAAGTYEVTAQARCRVHTTSESAWSAATSVVISDPAETIDFPPTTINGIAAGIINDPYEYTVAHSSQTNLGHAIEGRFDWGDGTFSDWINPGPYQATHTWTTEGTYIVRYEARCTVHPDLTASPDSLEVTITTTAVETVSKPGFVNYSYSLRNPEINVPRLYYAGGGTSSLGHALEVRIDWGDGTISDWVAQSTSISKTWTAVGTYNLIRQARCAAHPDIESEWSDPTVINALAAEVVSAPDAPEGPATGIRYDYMNFTASGAESSWHTGHLEYRFDWGDGTDISDWSTDTVVSHRWTNLGVYEVTTQARCVFPGHTAPESDWSPPATIEIVEEISTNFGPRGPYYAYINEANTYSIYSASSDVGHALEYQFDWGDGSYSDWSDSESADHAFTSVGTYDVYFRARCAEHTNAVSEWSSQYRRTEVTSDAETVSVPARPHWASLDQAHVDEDLQFSTTDAFSNHGHALEFQFDFGDGTVSEWVEGTPWSSFYQGNVRHTYTEIGTYEVTCKARCATHPGIESAVSEARTMEIYEVLDTPAIPTGPETGTTGANLTFTTTGSSSSEGHTLEYQFEYLRGTYSVVHTSDWSTALTDDHVFTEAGSYNVRVYARCSTHTGAVSYPSQRHYVVISD